VKRAIVGEIRERTSRIAHVEVHTHESRAAAAPTGARPAPGGLPSTLATLARWDRPAQWAVGGLAAYFILWQLVRRIARRLQAQRLRVTELRSPDDRPVATALPHGATRRHADLADESLEQQADRLLERLDAADPAEWRLELAGISPEVIGALLQTLEPDRVSRLMGALAPEAQQQALAHLAGLGPLGQPPAPLVQPVRRVALPSAVQAGDPGDLDELDDADPALLRTLYARLPGEVWSTALMGASAAFRVRLLSALPAGDAASLRQSFTRQRPARLRDIETAQQQVLELLHASGALAATR
jgi:hypothetical protein